MPSTRSSSNITACYWTGLKADELLALHWGRARRNATSDLGKARWRVSGVLQTVAAALPEDRIVRVTANRPAFSLSLRGTRRRAAPQQAQPQYAASSCANRSARLGEDPGSLQARYRAETADQADAFLDGLKNLHQRYWVGRGKPGAFAEPFFERFHRALIRRAAAGQSDRP